MNFIYIEYLPVIIIASLLFAFIVIRFEFRFFSMIKLYWFYKRSFFSYLSSIFMLVGILLLLISLMDARGPEERIKTQTPIERTVILIDTSASMLAEDVRPSRLQKAAMVAKHFARKAIGHQISVVVFAQIQKKIVPFTSDLDLIDSRLESIKGLRNQNGASSLTLAIQESLQYFKESGSVSGNLLVLTDGEENGAGLELDIPKSIRLAMVGIGTSKGGKIPLDDGRGFRFGYKKYKGEDVVTKLNESFFKKTVENVPAGKYWIANSYSLPSEEVVEYFSSEMKKGEREQDMVIKPVMMQWLVIPALISLIFSYLFKSVRIFTLSFIFCLMPVQAEEELTPEIQERIESFQKGKLSRLEKLKLADELSRAGAKDQSLALYDEELSVGKFDKNLPPEVYLNYGTTLLEKGEGERGLSIYEKMGENLDLQSEGGKKIKDLMDKNSMVYFRTQQKKEQEQKEQKQQKKEQEQKDQSQNSKNEDQQSQGQKKEQKEPSDKDGQQDKSQDDKKNDNEGDKKEEEKNDSSKDKPKDEGDKKEMDKPMPRQKIPAKLKQLMSDDRQLQMKMIESGTKDLNKRKNSATIKDW